MDILNNNIVNSTDDCFPGGHRPRVIYRAYRSNAPLCDRLRLSELIFTLDAPECSESG